MKIKLPETVTRSISKGAFELKKHSPEIFVATGIVGVIAGTVMACKATTKIDRILEESKNKIDVIHDAMENEELIESGKYTEEDGKKDLAITYVHTGFELAKVYAPSVAVMAISIGCIVKGTGILKSRNLALASAYTAVFNDFKSYRNRVAEEFGEEVERKILHGIKAQQIEVKKVDENGNEVTETEEVSISTAHNKYTRCFDELNPFFDRDVTINKSVLMGLQAEANARLRMKGILFLNDVYEMLGFERTKEGQVVGWKYDLNNPNLNNYVDFGIFKPSNSNFVNEYEAAIWLDFNVDGNVWETM